MTHNSLARLPESLRLMEWQGLEPRVLAQRSLEFRSFINRDWLDELTARGLYTVRDGRAYETLYVVEATLLCTSWKPPLPLGKCSVPPGPPE